MDSYDVICERIARNYPYSYDDLLPLFLLAGTNEQLIRRALDAGLNIHGDRREALMVAERLIMSGMFR